MQCLTSLCVCHSMQFIPCICLWNHHQNKDTDLSIIPKEHPPLVSSKHKTALHLYNSVTAYMDLFSVLLFLKVTYCFHLSQWFNWICSNNLMYPNFNSKDASGRNKLQHGSISILITWEEVNTLVKSACRINIFWKILICCCYLVTKSCPTLVTPWTVACQASLSMGFPKQGSGLPFPSPWVLPDPRIEPISPVW